MRAQPPSGIGETVSWYGHAAAETFADMGQHPAYLSGKPLKK